MSTVDSEAPEQTRQDTTPDVGQELFAMRTEMERQGRTIRKAQSGFSIFAVLAFILALATFIAVVAKLDAKSSTTSSATPAAKAQPAAAATTAAPLGHSADVNLREFVVDTSVKSVAAGNVRFAVRNTGKVAHEFVVLRTAKPAADLLKGSRADESGNVGETGDLAPGAAKTLTLKLKAGHYALICNLPGHYQSGQHTDLTVR